MKNSAMSDKFDYGLLRQFGRIVKLYWLSSQKWQAIASLILLIFLSFISTAIMVGVSIFLGELESSLAAVDNNRFLQAVLTFLGILLIGVPILSLKVYVQSRLSLSWRQWLTEYFLHQYLHQRNFYELTITADIDNPDQRIGEDIENFTQQSLYFAVVLWDSILLLIAFSGVLWRISPALMVFLIIYAIAGTVITTIVFGRTLVGINFEQLKREADFRYGLIRVRDHAEAIAFYQGEAVEYQELWQRFLRVFSNFTHLIRWQLGLDLFQNSYQYITFLLPTFILAPQILTGELELGVSAQAGVAFRSILIALGLVVSQFEQLSNLAAAVTRLDELQNSLKELQNPTHLSQPRLNTVESSGISFENVTLQTPDYQKILVQDLSFSISPGQSLLITGKSGVGKTSLLRALAGLWQAGTGTITHPKRSDLLFLPQRPYMILGCLREQLLYPQPNNSIPENQLLQTLQQVNLTDLVQRFGGLDITTDWGTVLSMGEQQRLAFARLLLQSPQYAILDEATSALDETNQTLLYQQLQKTEITYISVGHRTSLRSFHPWILELKNHNNRLKPIKTSRSSA
ncbi:MULTISPECIES: ABC transporter ATP-binding protein/permease [Cyanophyceae]|uniref:ABC transporter ATP-binding protein/permease n=2 Tax=Cyanobacteriota TaxID=1117 RepID=UPI00232BC0F7|nr:MULTISPECIES: ABC transporter ATP-binding protein/permease [Cyanophyceae]MDB9341615.1 ABC transporter ATP-binding protein/permease [Nodularia spumigena CS-589/07]MDB9356712.1 ABC transporter ATP-binding protein/permease [Nodularia spumigena CS-587/03]MDB9399144.1 ABC transporter ATP-binding protein/permease [Microcystis aeruginosa CS-567/02-A1]MDB9499306.1 ABC transporter ATP-binding protein/permease [Nodularia spumigena CS-336/02]MDB9530202.1 ABC transporter ATP-binding protein/permease [N